MLIEIEKNEIIVNSNFRITTRLAPISRNNLMLYPIFYIIIFCTKSSKKFECISFNRSWKI